MVMEGTQTVFGGQTLAGRIGRIVQRDAKPEFNFPFLNADLLDHKT
jgi:hypothetical protein